MEQHSIKIEIPYSAYLLVILISSIWTTAWTVKQLRPKAFKDNVPPWTITWIDGGLFVWSVVFCCFVAYSTVDALERVRIVVLEPTAKAVLSGISAQCLVAVLFLTFIRFNIFSFQSNFYFKAPRLWKSLFIRGILYGMGLLIPLMLISYACVQFMMMLRLIGINLQADDQALVRFILSQTSPAINKIIFIASVSVVPWAEELLFRGGIYRFLKAHVSTQKAIGLSSVLFAALHCHGPSFFPLLALGIALCYIYEKEQTIYSCILVHIIFNAHSLILLFIQNYFQ